MAFAQAAPSLPPPFESDRVLRQYLERLLPAPAREQAFAELEVVSDLAAGPLYDLLLRDKSEPTLENFDAWGNRIDRITLTPLWQEARRVAAEHGLVSMAYERPFGAHSRIVQFAKVYLFDPSSAVYTCPLAMTDGAAKILSGLPATPLIERALSHLLSRDPMVMWTSGQWMTERTGGSDVGLSETVARGLPDGRYALYGTKWFTSATTSEMALTLARPEGNPPSGRGLALFYVELRDAAGSMNGIRVNRLKDKLGTRMVPTAELELDGTVASALCGTDNGVRNIAPMLGITRTWNSVCAAAQMRRALMLARDYSTRRFAFGKMLSEQPLHLHTLAGMSAEAEGAFALTFEVVRLLGREECAEASADEMSLLRILTPVVKLVTGKQAVEVVSEAIEVFAGAGYVEDTGLPRLLRDAHVFPIWEGTTNVLSLDLLRALEKGVPLDVAKRRIWAATETVVPEATLLAARVREAFDALQVALAEEFAKGRDHVEAFARNFALSFGRTMQVALMLEHACWAVRTHGDFRSLWAAARLAETGLVARPTRGGAERGLALDVHE